MTAAPRQSQSRPRAAARSNLAFTVIAATPALFDLPQQLAGLGLTILVAYPVLAAWVSRRSLIVADPIVVVGVMWVLAAGTPALLPQFYADPIWARLSRTSLDMATLWMYRAWAACSLGYWLIRSLPDKAAAAKQPPNAVLVDRMRIAIGSVGLSACVAGFLMTAGQAYTHLDGFAATSTLDQVVHELRQFSKVYVFLFFFSRAQSRLLPREHWLIAAILAIYVLVMGAAAAKSVAIELIAMWVLGNAAGAARGKLLRELLLGAVALVALYLAFLWVTAYRIELRDTINAPSQSISEAVGQQIDAAGRAFGAVIAGDTIGSPENPYDLGDMLDRLAYVSAFATMLDITGREPPYENAASSLLAPLYAVLPRNLFDEKVQFFGSGEFAQLLGWPFGGFSVTLPGSLYWAWGFEGVLPAMVLLGAGLATLVRRGESQGPSGLFARVLLLGVVLCLLNVGVHMQAIVISAVRLAGFTAFIFFVLSAMPVPRSHVAVARTVSR